MNEKTVEAPEISCGHCVATIERELRELEGVSSVTADAETRRVTVRWQAPAEWAAIAELLREIGYPPAEG